MTLVPILLKPDPALINAAQKRKQQSSFPVGSIIDGLVAASDSPYLPPAELNATYHRLASAQPNYLFGEADSMTLLDEEILSYMKSRGFNWTVGDFQNYTVLEPVALEVSFNGLRSSFRNTVFINGPFEPVCCGWDPVFVSISFHRLFLAFYHPVSFPSINITFRFVSSLYRYQGRIYWSYCGIFSCSCFRGPVPPQSPRKS